MELQIKIWLSAIHPTTYPFPEYKQLQRDIILP